MSGWRLPDTATPYELVRTMRASIIVMGPLVARLGEATHRHARRLQHRAAADRLPSSGLEKLGARIHPTTVSSRVHSNGLTGDAVPLDYPSVGATENLVMMAAAADGETVIENAAREPEIIDLCAFLCGMGANISGAGSSTIDMPKGGAGRRATTP